MDMETSKCPTSNAAAGRASLVGQAGMTLLEILIVLAIIALVMGFLFGPRLMAMFGQSRTELAKSVVQRYASEAYARWSMDNTGKSCPADINELAKYNDEKEAKDPWGKPLILLCGDNAPEGVQLGVVSMGADNKLDTKDDIKSWQIHETKSE
jgi:prepilin-type N-terminal cleavage/methylation domain-containing protein